MREAAYAENKKDRPRLVGKASGDRKKAVKVPPEGLANYARAYEFRFPENPTQPVMILVPLSGKVFSNEGVPCIFVMNDRAAVTHFRMQAAEGDLKAVNVK